MTEADASQSEASRRHIGPRSIVFVNQPKMRSWQLFMIAPVVAWIGLHFLNETREFTGPVLWLVGIVVAASILLSSCACVFNGWRQFKVERNARRRLEKREFARRGSAEGQLAAVPARSAPGSDVTTLIETMMLAHARPTIDLLRREMARHRWGMPEVIADEGLQNDLVAIPVMEQLVEPERIKTNGGIVWAVVWVGVLTGLFQLCWPVFVDLWAASVTNNPTAGRPNAILFMLPFLAFQAAILAPMFIRFGRVMVSPGVAECGRKRWTTRDTVVILRRRFRQVTARLEGEKHRMTLGFRGVKDKNFIAFWQCWNHANPRPELGMMEEAKPAEMKPGGGVAEVRSDEKPAIP